MNPLLSRIVVAAFRLLCLAAIAVSIYLALTARPGGGVIWIGAAGSALGGIILSIIAECLLDLVEIAREQIRQNDSRRSN